MIPESRFTEWLAANAGDVEEAIDDISERFRRLLERVGLHPDDPIVDNLQAFMFTDPL